MMPSPRPSLGPNTDRDLRRLVGEPRFPIELSPEASDDLGLIRTFDARRVVAAMESQLVHEPTRETRNRKRLRPNGLAEWEPRVDVFRVSYDVRDDVVRVVAIGLKQGNDLCIHRERYEL